MTDVSAMLEEMDDHGFTDTEGTRKVSMLNDALYDAALRSLFPWRLTTATLTFNGSSSQPTNQPANLDVVADLVHNANGLAYPLEPVRTDDIDKRGTDLTQSGDPTEYYFVGDELHVYPVPGASTTLRLRYYRIPTALTDSTLSADVDFPVQHHRVLVLGGLYRLYDLEDDPELAVRFQGHFESRLAQMISDTVQQVDRPEYIHPVDGFDLDYWD